MSDYHRMIARLVSTLEGRKLIAWGVVDCCNIKTTVNGTEVKISCGGPSGYGDIANWLTVDVGGKRVYSASYLIPLGTTRRLFKIFRRVQKKNNYGVVDSIRKVTG